jgi:hypothetical protein
MAIRPVCVVITVAVVMLLRDFRPYGIIFTTMRVYYFRFPVIFYEQFSSTVFL